MICNACGVELNEANWSKSRRLKHDYKCKPCHNQRYRARPAYQKARTTSTIKKQFHCRLSRKITNFMTDAKRRNKQLDIKYKEIGLLMQMPCAYCGADNVLCGLDRVDSSKGYLKSNVVPCCKVCNYGKHVLTAQQYIEHCKAVVRFALRSA